MANISYQIMRLLYAVLNKHKLGRDLKYNFDFYLDKIMYVLKFGIPWRAIQCDKLHYTTYHKFFQKLVKLNIFELTYEILVETYCGQNPDKIKTLFIDSSMIKNINGKDNVGRNHYDRNRKGNKITVLVNCYGIPVSIFLSPSNIHDSKLIDTSIDKSVIRIVKTKIISDKGYINKKIKNKLNRNRNIRLIYPYRKNQEIKNTSFEKNLLRKRHIVENFFSWLKKYRRIQQRYDSKSINYFNFVYLGVINIIAKKIF